MSDRPTTWSCTPLGLLLCTFAKNVSQDMKSFFFSNGVVINNVIMRLFVFRALSTIYFSPLKGLKIEKAAIMKEGFRFTFML